MAVGTNSYVWVDNKIDASYNLTQTDWNATASTFDGDYGRETAAFAPAFNAGLAPYNGSGSGGGTYTQCDANGDALAQAFPPYQATPDLSGSRPAHQHPRHQRAGEHGRGRLLRLHQRPQRPRAELRVASARSQQQPADVRDRRRQVPGQLGSTVADENYWRTQDMPRSVPHEFQHYLHALNKVLVPDLVTGSARGVFDDSFVDEGDSMLAEDLVLGAGANPPQSPDSRELAFEYMYTPGNYSLTAFTGYDVDPLEHGRDVDFGFFRSTAGNYGGAYLFARYLYDRFGGDARCTACTPT